MYSLDALRNYRVDLFPFELLFLVLESLQEVAVHFAEYQFLVLVLAHDEDRVFGVELLLGEMVHVVDVRDILGELGLYVSQQVP